MSLLRRSFSLRPITLVAASSFFLALAVNGSAAPEGAANKTKALAIAHSSNCFSCHAIDQRIVGPSFSEVAQKFAGQPDAKKTLVAAVKDGHVGTWGKVPMPPHPELSKKQIGTIVAWILSLKHPEAGTAGTAHKTYTYKIGDKTFTTEFPIFRPGTQKVTANVFRGFELYNSYCFRCHGEDVTGSMYAPDLRRSLNNGMTRHQFLTIAMEGRKAKGMPSWAGFFSPHEIKVIYEYVKARAIGAVSVGTPET